MRYPDSEMPDSNSIKRHWYVLALLTITGTFVAAMPFSCMPVLFQEMSRDLRLDVVQIGTVWGISSLAGVFVSLLGGVLSDKFGAKTILVLFCVLTGITGALRGFATDFFSLTATVFLNGMVRLVIPVAVTKTLGMWFRGPRLGLAQGIGAMGMGLGLTLGPLISATLLSPALGGWRNVMFLYGAISAFVGILWLAMGKKPPEVQPDAGTPARVPLRQALAKLLRLKPLWLLGLTLMFRIGGVMGMTGYLPLYLSGKGWAQAAADGTLSLFYAVSTLSVIPLSFLSDRLGSRKAIMLPALVVSTVCIGVLPVAPEGLVWVLMVLSGMFMDAFMAITVTMLMETAGVGMEYAGMALGILFTIAQIGSLVSPPLGNAFAHIDAGLPFVFWAALSAAALGMLIFVKETGWRKSG
jgi:NNP family nitrate/nitrite transporter-like MFS transporter